MLTYWCCKTKVFDDGTARAVVFPLEAEGKPKNTMVETKLCDVYHDYFENFEDAKRFAEDAEAC